LRKFWNLFFFASVNSTNSAILGVKFCQIFGYHKIVKEPTQKKRKKRKERERERERERES
jgi:hypothetical protein